MHPDHALGPLRRRDPRPARRDARARPAHPRRPHARLRLRQRARRGRRAGGRDRRGLRRHQRPGPHRVPEPGGDGARAGRVRGRAARRAARARRVGHVRRHRVVPARRARRPRRAARRRGARARAAVHRARGVPQGRAPVRAAHGRSSTSTPRPSAPTRSPPPPRSPTAPCSSSPRRRRTRTAWSTRWPRSPLPQPVAVSAATSTPASAGGCCRSSTTTRNARRGPSRSRASRASRSTCTSTATPPRAPRCCCTARTRCGAASCSPGPSGPATRWSTRPCSPPARADRSPGRGPPSRRSAPTATAGSRGRRASATLAVAAGVDDVEGLHVVARPDSTLLAARHRRPARRVHPRRRDGLARVVRAAPAAVRGDGADAAPVAQRGHAGRRAGARPGRGGRRRPRVRTRAGRPAGGRPGRRARPRGARRAGARAGCSPRPGSPTARAGWRCPSGWRR